MNEKIILMSGLPGSGKSTMAQKIMDEADERRRDGKAIFKDCRLLDFDKCRSEEEMEEYLDNAWIYKGELYIVDGLFLTNEQRVKILNLVYKRLKSFGIYNAEVEIYEWNEDRDACVSNDSGRRAKSSATSIRNLPFEPSDVEVIEAGLIFQPYDISIKHLTVKAYSTKEKVMSRGNWHKEKGKLVSNSWCGGGTWGDCWGHAGAVAGETPVEFTQLDSLLEELHPDITFLQYKQLLSRCVTTDEYYEHDYYGGSTSNYRYVCDLEKLGEYLEELEER